MSENEALFTGLCRQLSALRAQLCWSRWRLGGESSRACRCPWRIVGRQSAGRGQCAGRSPVDRGKQGMKRSLMTDGHGIPLVRVLASASRQDSPLLALTLDLLIVRHLSANGHSFGLELSFQVDDERAIGDLP